MVEYDSVVALAACVLEVLNLPLHLLPGVLGFVLAGLVEQIVYIDLRLL